MEKHFVIGTAGHVDHGKTMLVKALTGKDTDRLKEEKERGISIELGFAPLTLPNGVLAGIVDVPGHERFIKNMLAGVGGMDLVLLVIAADEGVMPQTTEHLDIIKLLQVPRGMVVLTKVDLVDQDWVDLVEEEIRDIVKGTIFEEAPFIRVSSTTKQGIDTLLNLIEAAAENLEVRKASGWPRTPVDRVFTITGFGTVATGTLIEGTLKVGDPLEILPQGIETRVRTLQVHGKKVEEAMAGQRVAINLAGIELEQIERGNVLSWPGRLKPSHRLDVKLNLLESTSKQLLNRARVRVHLGTSEVLGRIILLDRDSLEPGDTCYAQIECEEEMVAEKKDRFVIRSYSPMHTIGGGIVIDPSPQKHKRFRKEVLDTLQTIEKGTPAELILQTLESAGQEVLTLDMLVKGVGLAESEVKEQLGQMTHSDAVKEIIVEKKSHYISGERFKRWGREIQSLLSRYHQKYPLRPGMAKEEVRSRLFTAINNKVFNALMLLFEREQQLTLSGESLALFNYVPPLTPEQEKKFATILDRFLKDGFQTPAWQEVLGEGLEGEEILSYLLGQDQLVKLEDNIILHREVYEQGKNKVIAFLKERGEITLGEARDLLNSSRKYVLPFLSRLDKEKITRRIEDKRVLFK